MNFALRVCLVLISALAAAAGTAASLRLHAAAADFQSAAAAFDSAPAAGDKAAHAALAGAADLARRSIARCPGDPDAHYLLGRIASREARHVDSATHLSDSLRINPFDANLHYYLGRALGESGRHEDAAKAVAVAADLGRNHPPLVYWVGYFHWALWRKNGRMIDLQKAFEYFRKAAEGDLSYLDASLKTVESFALHYDNVKQLIPDTPQAHHKAGRYMGHNRGLWTPALAEFVNAGTELEGDATFMFDRGLAKMFTGGDPTSDLLAGLKQAGSRHAWARRLVFYFQAAKRTADAPGFWTELEREYPDLPAAAVNRVEMEMIVARDSMIGFKKQALAEMNEAKGRAATAEERKTIEKFHMDRIKAEYASRIAPTEGYLREKAARFGDGELLCLLGDLLETQDRLDEAEAALRSGALAGNTAQLWKKYVEFLLRYSRFDAAWKAALDAANRFPADAAFKQLAKVSQDRMLGEKPGK